MPHKVQEIIDLALYIVAGIGALFIGFKTLVKKGLVSIRLMQKPMDLTSIKHILEKHRLELEADRVDLIATNYALNSSKPVYASLVQEAISRRSVSYMNGKWQDVLAGDIYLDIIRRTHQDGYYIGRTDAIGESVIKQAMVALEIDTTIWHKVGLVKSLYYVLAISWNEQIEITERELESIRITKEEILELIE